VPGSVSAKTAERPGGEPALTRVPRQVAVSAVPGETDVGGSAALAAFSAAGASDGGDTGQRVDVRCEPLAVRDGCAPDRIPAGRWVSDRALVRSEQFAVNEALAALRDSPGLFAVHAPSGTGVTAVFSDLVAAIITERARRLAELPDPAAAFGQRHVLGAHTVTAPSAELAGFEIVLAAPEAAPTAPATLIGAGSRWRDRAAETDYFTATAWLAGDEGGWAMLLARLGDRSANRAFADRWWRGVVRGTDVLFPVGEPMPAALRRLGEKKQESDWQTAVARFRAALVKARKLSAERMVVAAALTRLSAAEQACEEASAIVEAATLALADLTAREPGASVALAAAEQHRRSCLADLAEHELGRPPTWSITDDGKAALREHWVQVTVAGGLRRGRNWRHWTATRRELRTACAGAAQRRDAAARAIEGLRADLAAARTTRDRAASEVTRLAAQMGPLAETVGRARQRWGDFVPDGPSQAETEDAALIERRETSAPWADRTYVSARAEVFLAALALHKALIAAQASVLEANLAALMDMLTGAAQCDSATALAAWQSFFLVVPVVSVPLEAAGPLFTGLAGGALGWLLAQTDGQATTKDMHAALRLADRAVLAGDATLGGAAAAADQTARHGTRLPAGTWVATPLRVVRGQERTVINLRNDITYDGLLIPNRD
jgi:hypothetical protein